ncbi:hypothetical protein [Glaciibacter psychrotolerans]|uniref:Uncharacterized protein n=1 Tax=Glaciibacter psychrotolerans TaxID=670054 RepID=A0A7Z0ECL5_9MICO|nr:hypothetical protein [Leifsonia psychrotolerans]NYJ19166.1 hypothetical protein [Leifsonia psychrotolerans]
MLRPDDVGVSESNSGGFRFHSGNHAGFVGVDPLAPLPLYLNVNLPVGFGVLPAHLLK